MVPNNQPIVKVARLQHIIFLLSFSPNTVLELWITSQDWVLGVLYNHELATHAELPLDRISFIIVSGYNSSKDFSNLCLNIFLFLNTNSSRKTEGKGKGRIRRNSYMPENKNFSWYIILIWAVVISPC